MKDGAKKILRRSVGSYASDAADAWWWADAATRLGWRVVAITTPHMHDVTVFVEAPVVATDVEWETEVGRAKEARYGVEVECMKGPSE